jgi:dTDP-4-amino-4,6-dideoxygalactose transaminase
MLALGIGPGDEVITTPFTWVSTVNMIVATGAKPVFADIEPDSLNISVEDVERRISDRTRAIIPVHIAGYPCRMDDLQGLASRYGLFMIEDAAHALGTEIQGRRIGSLSAATCFSFHPTKNITTAEGGMITTNDGDLARRLRLWRFHGVSRDAWKRYGSGDLPHYMVEFAGFKYTMTDLQAALGISQLKKIDRFIEVRTRQALRYRQELEGVPGLELPKDADGDMRHAWNLYILRVKEDGLRIGRDEFMMELKKRGVLTGLHFSAVHLHTFYKERFGTREGQLPDAEKASREVLSLPLHPDLGEEAQAYVIESVREVALAHAR